MRVGRLTALFFALALVPYLAHADSNTDRAIVWLNAHQNTNGSWGSVSDLLPRDTARVLLAMQRVHSTSVAMTAGYAWLSSQSLDANELIGEEALALAAGKLDSSTALMKLAAQHSGSAPDYGGFSDHSGDSYDSALALQAFATNEALYPSNISGILTTLISRENVDGGWGIDQGFDSSPILTSEVLIGLAALRTQPAPPAVVAAAQTYLVRLVHADGSIGADVLQTALALRALAVSGYVINSFSSASLNYLRTRQAVDGSWSSDPYLTARVIEALAVDRQNLTLGPGDFVLTPGTVADGGSVTARVTIHNTGTQPTGNSTLLIATAGSNSAIASAGIGGFVSPGASTVITVTFTPRGLVGTHTLTATADANNELDEILETDNQTTATLVVTGKPDLQVFPADIATTPAHLQPNQPGQINLTIHNNGDGDVASVGYAVYDTNGSSPEALLQKSTTGAIPAGSSQTVQIAVNLSAGTHLIRAVADPDALIDEASEANNQATKQINVSNVTNVDLLVLPGSVTANPPRPAAGTPVTLNAIVQNAGSDPVQSSVAFYDGVPGSGGTLISTTPLTIDSQSSASVQAVFTTTASSKVVYVVADPDNLVSETDETNNSGFVTLTDQFTDLVVTRDSIVFPKPLPAAGQTMNARVVVRNNGVLSATGVEVIVYDDLPSRGGVAIVDTFVNVPALGSVVVPASWTVRAGQRFATAAVNPSHAVFEPDYTNNRATRLYTTDGSGTDVFLYNPTPNLSALVVDPLALTVGGFVQLVIQGSTTTPYLVTVFEDVDGDLAYNPEVDNPLGSLLVQPFQQQTIRIPVQGTVRFAPPHLMVYLDSGNAIAENNEANNLIDLYHSCQHSPDFSEKPRTVKWTSANRSTTLSPVGRILDTNGDGVIDANDIPAVVSADGGAIVLKRGDNGQTIWSVPLSTSGRQISPVIADLDGDGKAEIIAHLDVDPVTGAQNQHRLVALNAADGSRKWVSPQLDRDPQWDFYIGLGATYSYGGAPAVADLDGDGHPEVICGRTVLNGADGTIKWVGSGGSGRAWKQPDPSDPSTNLYTQFFPDQEAPIAVDLNNDGRLEVVAGNTAYRSDGTILWQRADLPDGYTAPLWLGNDVNPHICLVGLGRVWMLNADGTTFWGPVNIPNGALLGGAPTVFTNFGTVEVAVAGDGYLSAFNATTGAVLWTRQVATDVTSFGGTTTNFATTYSDAGFPDLFYASRDQFVIIRADNILVHTQPIANNPYFPGGPAIADLDGDGHADVIIPGTTGIQVVSDPSWNGAPAVFNEAAYHGVDATETGAIPQHVVQDAFSRVNFHANRNFSSSSAVLDPNLTLSYPRIDGRGYPAAAQLTVRLGNNGWAGAPAASIAFYRLNADNTSTLLSNVQSSPLAAGSWQDLSYTYPNPPSAFTFYAVADPNNTITECDKSDNRSPNLALHLSADVAVSPLGLVVDDPNPRQGDVSTFTAVASVTGAVNTSNLNAQFFLGNPASGGTAISPPLPVGVSTNHGNVVASVTFAWTVNAAAGQQVIFVVFDPANAIPEDNENNNAASVALNVTTPAPVQTLSGTLALTPPSAEAGTPVRIDIAVQNTGNVALSNVSINYSVTGPLSGSATLPSLGKNKVALLTLGTFTPAANGTYTVTASAAAPVTLTASPATLVVGPFAAASLSVVPTAVPTTLPVAQVHAHVSRTNTINVAADPLLSLVVSHLQHGADFEAGVLTSPSETQCFKCHVHAQGIVSTELARRVPGVNVNDSALDGIINLILHERGGDGRIYVSGYGTTEINRLAAWAFGYWHDSVSASQTLAPMLDETVADQQSDGSWVCDGACASSLGSPQAWTMTAVDSLTRGYDLTKNTKYLDAANRGVLWMLAWNYTSVTQNTCEDAARVSIALSRSLPYLSPDLAAQARNRIASIAAMLRSFQNTDGSVGTIPAEPVVRTAQFLYALSLSGAPSSDPAVRAATVWLLNNQKANGQFGSALGPCCTPAQAMDETTWAMIALAGSWASVGQFSADVHVSLAGTTDLISSSPPPATTSGRDYMWHLASLTDTGSDLYFNIRLNSLQNQEVRPVATSASVSYNDPNSGQPVSHPMAIPSVTGVSPVALSLTTDHPAYPSNSTVVVQENIANATAGITNDVVIRDASGATIATLATSEAISGLPTEAFPGWHYAIAATLTPPAPGGSRNAVLAIDFAQQLTQLGVAGTFDPHSIRVSADGTPSVEMPFTWFATAGSAGNLTVQILDNAAAGTPLPIHIYFDTLENGLKPVSLVDRNVTQVGAGLLATYNAVDGPHSNFQASDPSQLIILQPPFITAAIHQSQISRSADLDAVRWWEGVFTGAIYVPAAGTYQFLLGSDRGGWLDVDGVRLLSDPGYHELQEVTGSRALSAGFHTVRVTIYRWDNSGYDMYLKWAPPGMGFDLVPSRNLFLDVPFAASAGTPALLPQGQAARTYAWNTAATAAGSYSALATLHQNGAFVVSASASFIISANTQITANVATDKAMYDAGDTVHVTSSADYTAGNTPLTNLSAIVSIVDPSGAATSSRTFTVANLAPGQTAPFAFDWIVGSAPAGTYSASLVVKDSSGATLAQRSVPFQTRPTSTSGKGITGALTAPATVPQTQTITFAVSLTNAGNSSVTNAPFAVRIVDPATQQLIDTVPFQTSIALGATATTQVPYVTTHLALQTYQAWLVSMITGAPVPLSNANFQVTTPPTVVTASVTTDKSSYDPGDTLHSTTTVNYVTGAAPLANVTVTTTIVTASGTSTISSIAPGASATTTFNWPVGTTAPGSYTVSSVVKDASANVLAQTSSSFTIASTAQTGKGISGAISTPSQVTRGDALPIAATITDNGNAALTNAPFAVNIGNATINFTASVSMASSTTTQLTFNTAGLTPGNYTATLVSLITGQSVTLATTSFTVVPPTVVTASVTTDKSSYDPGDTLHSTTTVNYVSGAAPLANVTVTTTIATASGTSTISSIAPGASATTTFDWPVGTTAPGTYAVNVVVKDGGGNPLAQQSLSFTIASTATTGKGITGTISTDSSVIQGAPLAITATIADNGNAALTDAPFAVRIASDTVNFTASVAMGSSTTKQLTYATGALTPGNYTATLVSLITGQAVTLATTSFTVVSPTVVTASVTTDKSSYDPGDTLHSTTTVNYVSGLAPLVNVTVTTTIALSSGTATISSIAPGAHATTTFDWPVGTTAPGSYTVSSVVKDASANVLAQTSSSFTIASTAQTGKGITGTISSPASIDKGQPLPITVTLTNNGNAAIVSAPFAVQIGSNTLNFTASVAMGATTTTQLSYDTTPLAPQTYTATLVSLITGQPVTLASASFTVVVPQVISFSASPARIINGQSTTLSWVTANATSVTISGITAAQPPNGSLVVAPTTTTTYTLTATGLGGTASATTTVTVDASTQTSSTFNFNGTAIAAGDTVWFNSVFKVTGVGSGTTTVFMVGQHITFTSNNTNYDLAVPDGQIIFNDPTVTVPATAFDSATNTLVTRLPGGPLSGNTFLSALEFVAPSGGLPGGIHTVTWSANVAARSSTSLGMQWQWGAAVYTTFSTDYSALGIKPVDVSTSQYPNSDHAGTPENFRSYVIGGATGGGGSNYTGGLSGTVSVVPTLIP